MTIGSRIGKLRKAHNYSQEYIAEQLDISRQAVSKWENDTTAPDTHNLIKLAEILNTTVEYLAAGKVDDKPQTKKRRIFTKKLVYSLGAFFAFALIISAVIFIHTRPVSWDSGACGGGFATAVFDKYSEELVEKFVNGGDGIANAKAIRGSHEANWDGRMIFLKFDVEYENTDGQKINHTLHFTGKRVWNMVYKWGGATIEG